LRWRSWGYAVLGRRDTAPVSIGYVLGFSGSDGIVLGQILDCGIGCLFNAACRNRAMVSSWRKRSAGRDLPAALPTPVWSPGSAAAQGCALLGRRGHRILEPAGRRAGPERAGYRRRVRTWPPVQRLGLQAYIEIDGVETKEATEAAPNPSVAPLPASCQIVSRHVSRHLRTDCIRLGMISMI